MADTEKRKYQRHSCSIKTRFRFYDGDPDEFDPDKSRYEKGNGYILDVSAGGLFIVSNDRVAAGAPVIINFKTGKNKYDKTGRIVRTGLLEKNPSEIARKFSRFSSKGDTYIAIEFDTVIENFSL